MPKSGSGTNVETVSKIALSVLLRASQQRQALLSERIKHCMKISLPSKLSKNDMPTSTSRQTANDDFNSISAPSNMSDNLQHSRTNFFNTLDRVICRCLNNADVGNQSLPCTASASNNTCITTDSLASGSPASQLSSSSRTLTASETSLDSFDSARVADNGIVKHVQASQPSLAELNASHEVVSIAQLPDPLLAASERPHCEIHSNNTAAIPPESIRRINMKSIGSTVSEHATQIAHGGQLNRLSISHGSAVETNSTVQLDLTPSEYVESYILSENENKNPQQTFVEDNTYILSANVETGNTVAQSNMSVKHKPKNHVNIPHDEMISSVDCNTRLFLFDCNACTNSFSTEAALLEHKKIYHSLDTDSTLNFPCLTCGKFFKSFESLKSHVASQNHELTWYCYGCEQQFPEEHVLRIHSCGKRDNHKNVRQRFVCSKCSQVFYASEFFTQHEHQCVFREYCAQCAKHCESLKDILAHSKECGREVVACSECQVIVNRNLLPRRVHCRCCGKCFEDINAEFFEHEAQCGINNRYESFSSAIVFWPPKTKAVWADKCRTCLDLKKTNSVNKLDKREVILKRVHCTFCGKCFVEKSDEFIFHEKVCAWYEKCTTQLDISYGPCKNKLKLFSKHLQCNFCGQQFSEKFVNFFHHEANCKVDYTQQSKQHSSTQVLPLPGYMNAREPIPDVNVASSNVRCNASLTKCVLVGCDAEQDQLIATKDKWSKDSDDFNVKTHMQSCRVVIEQLKRSEIGLNSVENLKVSKPLESAPSQPGSKVACISSNLNDKMGQSSNTREINSTFQILSRDSSENSVALTESLPFVTEINNNKENSNVQVGNQIPVQAVHLPELLEETVAFDLDVKTEHCLVESIPQPPEILETTHNLGKEVLKIAAISQAQTLSVPANLSQIKHFMGNVPEIVPTHFCKLCKTTFDSEKLYTWHLRTHDEYRPYPCSYCGCRYKRLINLNEHIRFYHLRGQVPCYRCGKRFANSLLYRKHNKTHTQHFQFKRRKVDPLRTAFEIHKWRKKSKPQISTTVVDIDKRNNVSPIPMDVEAGSVPKEVFVSVQEEALV